jgi:transcription antitermination factor NusG
VLLKEGDFHGMKWLVTEIDAAKWFLYVNIEILGRNTPVMIAFEKVERVA